MATITARKVSDGLQWSDVDLKKRTAHLPKTKNGDARTVPLSSRAVATLALPSNLGGRVFGTTYEGIHQAFVRACCRAGIDGLTSTTCVTRPPAACSRRASTRWKFRPSRATRHCRC